MAALTHSDVKLMYQCMLSLYYNDGTEKHLKVDADDCLKVTYKVDDNTSTVVGRIVNIIPITVSVSDDCNCTCDCGCHESYNSATLLLEVTEGEYTTTRQVMVHTIVDAVIVDTDEEGNVVTDSKSIQELINDATAGDTIKLGVDVYAGDISIDKPITLSGAGQDKTIIAGAIAITAPDVVIDGVTIATVATSEEEIETAPISVTTQGGFSLKNSVVFNAAKVKVVAEINAAGVVEIVGNKFIDVGVDSKEEGIYNLINIGSNKAYPLADGSVISHNVFVGKIRHMTVNIYTFADKAHVDISHNVIDTAAGYRFSNQTSAEVVIDFNSNKYNHDSCMDTEAYEYAGIMFFQDYSDDGSQDFTKMTLNVNKLLGPSGERKLANAVGTPDQVYYVYSNSDGDIITDKNQPNVIFA